jgi:hypothetical protein
MVPGGGPSDERPVDRRRKPAHTEVVRKGSQMAAQITVEDNDDRPERMLRDPDRYFAEARRRAEQEVRHLADRWLPGSHRRKRS